MRKLCVILCAAYALFLPPLLQADSRIHTFVYSDQDVYKVNVVQGYQTTIEFAEKEKIRTISMGDGSGFKVTPATNRLFLKNSRPEQSTNMYVLTNERAYYFDLSSHPVPSKDAMYVIRFYYPGSKATVPPGYQAAKPQAIAPAKGVHHSVAPNLQRYLTGGAQKPAMRMTINANYRSTGNGTMKPQKIFDDGKTTFIQLPQAAQNSLFFAVTANGQEIPLQTQSEGPFVRIAQVMPKLVMRTGPEIICIYNDGMMTAPGFNGMMR